MGTMTVRLEYEGKVYGLSSVSVPAGFVADEEEHSLFKEVAGDIAFALHNIELQEDRRRAEETLRESEEQYRLLAENVTDIIWTMDMNFRFTYMSPSITRLGGYSVDEVMAMSLEEILTPTSLEIAVKTFGEELAAEKTQPGGAFQSRVLELGQRRKDGSTVWTEVTTNFLRDPEGWPVGIVGVTRDITERKRAEEKLKKTVVDLERSNADLERFAYVASHDLQEPLRMVSSYVQLLARRYEGQLDADADDFIGYAVGGANRMQRLINDLLAYSRVRTRGKPFEPTDCGVVLDQALANLQVAIEESGAVVTHDNLPTVMADSSQLLQLFQNLVDNGIKFCGEGPPREWGRKRMGLLGARQRHRN